MVDGPSRERVAGLSGKKAPDRGHGREHDRVDEERVGDDGEDGAELVAGARYGTTRPAGVA